MMEAADSREKKVDARSFEQNSTNITPGFSGTCTATKDNKAHAPDHYFSNGPSLVLTLPFNGPSIFFKNSLLTNMHPLSSSQTNFLEDRTTFEYNSDEMSNHSGFYKYFEFSITVNELLPIPFATTEYPHKIHTILIN